MYAGWLELGQDSFYLSSNGQRHVGWLTLEDGTYYLDPQDATMATGFLPLEEGTYFLDSQGRKQSGWQEIGDDRYYLDEDGILRTGWLTLEENRYYLGEDGAMHTGWLESEAGRQYLDESGILRTGWTDTPEGRYYLTEEGFIATGWLETEEGTLYLDENGQPYSGWLDLETGKFYLSETGLVTTGWLELEGDTYYFRDDGVMARGKVVIEEDAFYFTSAGKYVVMVNRWNPVPEDYTTDLVDYRGWKVSKECYDALTEMLKQVSSVGYYEITSAYRSISSQQAIWDRRMSNYLASGYSKEGAYTAVIQSVAIPGTSEHHLGLAIDIAGGTSVHGWLAEHCWEYGFIVRYPDGKTDVTGIIYEPWHYRYVGKDLAKELYDLGLTMEEYMDMLTAQEGYGAGTASDPEKFG